MSDKCLDCSETQNDILNCPIIDCSLYPIRLNRVKIYDKDGIEYFKRKCLNCCRGQVIEVKRCPAVRCPLHQFRDMYWD